MGIIKSKKSLFSKIIVMFIICINIIFTVAVLKIFLTTQVEPTTLIVSWFSFTTVELWSLAGIKKQKTKQKIGDDNIG